jgi:hypothetical protein
MTDGNDRRLVAAGIVYAVGSALHMLDHVRRGADSGADELNALGTLGLVMQVVAVTLIVTRHRLAPLVAVAAGVPLAVRFLGAHWFPEWSALSDPVREIDSWTWFSYLASTAEIAGALATAIAGIVVVRDRGLASFARRPPTPPPPRRRSAPT